MFFYLITAVFTFIGHFNTLILCLHLKDILRTYNICKYLRWNHFYNLRFLDKKVEHAGGEW